MNVTDLARLIKSRPRMLFWSLAALTTALGGVATISVAGSPARMLGAGPAPSALYAAKVNGVIVSRAAFEQVWGETQKETRALDMQENRHLVLDSMVGAELLAQQALSDRQLMADPKLQGAMEMQQRNLLASAYATEYLRRNPVGDAALQAAYKQFVSDLGAQEFHLRHIVLSSQEAADALYLRISKGELSMIKAQDQTEERGTDGRRAGADLGWVAAGRIAPKLREKVLAMKGTGLLKPYADQAGWHLVQVEDARAVTVPAFDAVREELIPLAQRAAIREHMLALKSKASISS